MGRGIIALALIVVDVGLLPEALIQHSLLLGVAALVVAVLALRLLVVRPAPPRRVSAADGDVDDVDSAVDLGNAVDSLAHHGEHDAGHDGGHGFFDAGADSGGGDSPDSGSFFD